MTNLQLKTLQFGETKVLTRAQMKHIKGGDDGGGTNQARCCYTNNNGPVSCSSWVNCTSNNCSGYTCSGSTLYTRVLAT
ncbi:MAG: hypothetical protein JWR09_5103 [Mucilaginibacter sp.]|nr:hypothetical protein [Mucilaginibacter sp.]